MVAVLAYYLEYLAPADQRRDYVVADDIKKYFPQAGYAPYVQQYFAALDQTPEGRDRIMATDPSGKFLRFDGQRIVVRFEGGLEMAWADAVTSKRIKIA